VYLARIIQARLPLFEKDGDYEAFERILQLALEQQTPRISSGLRNWATSALICRTPARILRAILGLLLPVNAVQTAGELAALRRSVTHGTPYGSEEWVKRTAQRLGLVDCTGEAYCQARQRLPLGVLQYLVRALSQHLGASTMLDDGRWHGHRTFLVGGSGVSMPDTPALQKQFGQPGGQAPGCGFPVMHLLALFHATTGFLLNVVGAPLRTHDLSRIGQLHPDLSEGDVLVGDRGFCSFAHLALLAARKVFGVFRVHQKQIVDFRPHRRRATRRSRQRGERGLPSSRWLRRLGRHDQLVEYSKPKQRPTWLTAQAFAALPDTLTVRELRYTIAERGRRTRVITLATTLLDPQRYPAADVAALYAQRWQIETNFRHLKQTLRMDVLRCKTVEGVKKELAVYALVYNLVRLVMREAAQRQGVPVARISFIDAVRWLADAIHGAAELCLRLIPERPGRFEPRAVKRRPKEYNRLNQPREVLRKRLLSKTDAA
jgi:DDE family transposase